MFLNKETSEFPGKQYNIASENNRTAVLLVQLFVDKYFGRKTKKANISVYVTPYTLT